MDAVLGRGDAGHWVTHLVAGSFSAPGADEWLALVGNIGDQDEIRWVVVRQTEDGGRLLGTSDWLGAGFDAPPSFYLPPDLLDFDGDGQQEVLHHYFRMQRGWTTSADALYRWDGRALARVWSADTILDNTTADDQDVPQPYRESYQAEWEWMDLNDDGLDEILLRERVTFHPADRSQWEGDVAILGEETGERAFRWDGDALRPYAPDGPAGAFAYTVLGDLWLWQDRTTRPLGAGHVRDIRWSPDGLRLAWWSQPSPGGDSQGALLGIYDLATDTWREFSLANDEISALRWTPDGRVAYALPDHPPVLLDPETGQQEPFPAASLGTWSPDGDEMAYERDGGLFVYDLAVGQERSLVVAPEGAEAPTVLSPLAWSPRGDWIACRLGLRQANEILAGVALVAPDLAEPLDGSDLRETFGGREAPELEFAWAPDGSHLAALTTDPASAPQPRILYLAEVPSGVGRAVGRLEWRALLQWETITRTARLAWSPTARLAWSPTARLAWSPCGDRMALAVGNQVWEVTTLGEKTLRRRFAMPDSEWTTLEWAPDGSGFLVGLEWAYSEQLYWFPSGGTDSTLLLAGSLGAARWAPGPMDTQNCPQVRPAMVLVDYTDGDPLFHFTSGGQLDVIVSAMGETLYTPFQIGGERVYYDYRYADQSGVTSLVIPDVSDSCHPPLVSPDGSQLAWLCDDGPPDLGALIDGTEEIHFRLILTDGEGRGAREVWSHDEVGPDYRDIRLISWRVDGEAVYLSQPKYGAAWAYFDYNPGILAVSVNDGQATQIGDLDGVHDGLVSPAGDWLVQSRIVEWPDEGVVVTLRSLVDGTEWSVTCAEGAMVAGDFSFSPDNTWLAWREWARAPGGSMLLVRVLRLPDGEPLTVFGDTELAAPQIGGWLGQDDLVLVYPKQEGGTGGHSTVVTLPAIGPGALFSSYAFLGVLGETP